MEASQIANWVTVCVGSVVLLGAAMVAYVVLDARRRNQAALAKIANYVREKNFPQAMVSFEAIRAYIDESYDDSFLIALAKAYPRKLRLAYLKDPETGKNTRSGFQVLSELQSAAKKPQGSQRIGAHAT